MEQTDRNMTIRNHWLHESSMSMMATKEKWLPMPFVRPRNSSELSIRLFWPLPWQNVIMNDS